MLCKLSFVFWFLDAVTTSAIARTSRNAITPSHCCHPHKHLGGSKHKTAERAFVRTQPGEPVPGTTVRQPLPPAEAAAAAASRAMRPHLLPPHPAPPSAPATSAGATAGSAGPGASHMLPAPPPPPQRLPRAGFASGPVRSGSAVSSGPTPSPLPLRSSMSLPNAAPGMRRGHRPALMVPRQVALGQQLQPAPSGAAQATAGPRRNEGFSACGRRAVTTPSEQQRAAAATATAMAAAAAAAEAGGTPQHSSPPARPAAGGAHRAECKVCRWTGSTAELAQHFQARSIISSIEDGTMLTNNR